MDTMTLIGIAAVGVALAILFLRSRQGTSTALVASPMRPTSISRMLDDLKHEHADPIFGARLGAHQAAQLVAALSVPSAPGPQPTAPTSAPPAVAPPGP
jgi:hypothetical protein